LIKILSISVMGVSTFLGSWIITESVKAPEDEMVKNL
jgi:hypothetical protein